MTPPPAIPKRIVSGGQTGADRAALDFARTHGIPHGGWCPQGRLAEDGELDLCYRLQETPSSGYAQRTEWNVRDADGTVIFSVHKELFGGSKLTAELATRYNKPCLHISKQTDGDGAAEKLRHFIAENKIQTLNVAGSRGSNEPEISVYTSAVLKAWFQLVKQKLQY